MFRFRSFYRENSLTRKLKNEKECEFIQIKTIIWDFDGTLADTSQDVWYSLEYAAKQCGGEISLAYRQETKNLALPMKEIFSQVCPQETDQQLRQFERLVRYHYRNKNSFKETAPYSGIEALLYYLYQNGYRQLIATMKPRAPLTKLLNLWNWHLYFEDMMTQDFYPEIALTKSEMVEILSQKHGIESTESWVIGDSASDIEAAKLNGFRSIGVTYGDGDTEQLRLSKPDRLFQCSQELKAFFMEGEF